MIWIRFGIDRTLWAVEARFVKDVLRIMTKRLPSCRIVLRDERRILQWDDKLKPGRTYFVIRRPKPCNMQTL
jgi:hypothetical protein